MICIQLVSAPSIQNVKLHNDVVWQCCWSYCSWRYPLDKLHQLSCKNCLQSTTTSLLSDNMPLMPWSIDAEGSPQNSDGWEPDWPCNIYTSMVLCWQIHPWNLQQNCWYFCGCFFCEKLEIILPRSLLISWQQSFFQTQQKAELSWKISSDCRLFRKLFICITRCSPVFPLQELTSNPSLFCYILSWLCRVVPFKLLIYSIPTISF